MHHAAYLAQSTDYLENPACRMVYRRVPQRPQRCD